MGTIIIFPTEAAAQRRGVEMAPVIRKVSAQILILPVIRIERQCDDSNGQGPDEGAAPRRGRKRRARS